MANKTFMLLLGPMSQSQMLAMVSAAGEEDVRVNDVAEVTNKTYRKPRSVAVPTRKQRKRRTVQRGKDKKPRKRRKILNKKEAQELYRLRSYETNYLTRRFNVSKSTVARVVNRQGRYKRMNLK